ncbi:MAG TPA: ATP-dependent metallopeptidase FtsH/Yme1/Tma family protein, partial [Bacteroidia bacterium]|nr:ATP-dependent metallopeptidase FtsH/Yme1/Tma family protein [Bacteroidia bacterium]
MSDQEQKGNKNMRDKFPKKPNLPKTPFNFYWIYGIIVVVLIAMQLMNLNGGLQEVKSSDFFETMLKQNQVTRIVVIPNEQIAEIYIDPKYFAEYPKANLASRKNGPHFKLKILSVESFKSDLNDAQKDVEPGKRIYPESDPRTSWMDSLSWLLPVDNWCCTEENDMSSPIRIASALALATAAFASAPMTLIAT